MGKTGPLVLKSKTRAIWEEQLNKTNLSNDDYCDALIKKAMEGIKDRPPSLPTPPEEEQPAPTPPRRSKAPVKKDPTPDSSDNEQDDVNLKQVKLSIEKCDEKPLPRSSRANKVEPLLDGITTAYPKKTRPTRKSEVKEQKPNLETHIEDDRKPQNRSFITSFSMDYFEGETPQPPKTVTPPKVVQKEPEPPPKPFNIMDHVCTIKVNGVGILFQCKLCNRNFLKKEVVESHGCAKNNVPKDISQNSMPIPEPPRPPTVKYITLDKDFKKNLVNDCNRKVEKLLEQKVAEKPPPEPVNPVVVKQEPVNPPKPKPKAGPASKTRKLARNEPPAEPKQSTVENPSENTSILIPLGSTAPTVNFPSTPSMFSRYKLVPGPNNSFTLVEDTSQKQAPEPEKIPSQQVRKRKLVQVVREQKQESISDIIDLEDNETLTPQIQDQRPKNQPYPVGLYQSVPHNSNVYPTQLTAAPFVQAPFAQVYTQAAFQPPSTNQMQYANMPVYNTSTSVLPHAQSVLPHPQSAQSFLPHQQSAQTVLPHPQPAQSVPLHPQSAQSLLRHPQSAQSILPHPQSTQSIVSHSQSDRTVSVAPPTFTTPAMKKQSYTVVQTGHPSKLLISTKPQPAPTELYRKLSKKELAEEKKRQSFQFVNVEPGAQTSYVLPTDNIIQESQISTSSVGDSKTYTCNMCNEKFSREKKLLAHIQSHYNAMDAEDHKRTVPASKKRGRKS